ncbi:carboxymuconolactone decarboxylase family protein [Actinopolymorpha pittospori]|uniref:AhpD family alkylhydroperoxidase n=1 Tax=Actinopolymorpha pittospori TaxID=648752 RepID=A0A927RBH4_9ACTN|nr:carboxymuconolactone decarboxylase family protein [Actinopolymorpha pittospori]MBE1610142.1 AhpD family alkylhydroperoxidase [Actinopolymorpha pittospori]
MQARMNHPAMTVPGAMKALIALGESTKEAGVAAETLELVHLRASQVNGCSACVDMHARVFKRPDEADERGIARVLAVAAWRDAPYFTDAERAALALTEAVTRLSERADPVHDEVWEEAARHYDESQLSTLLVSIATVNVWNRLNVATRQVAGSLG